MFFICIAAPGARLSKDHNKSLDLRTADGGVIVGYAHTGTLNIFIGVLVFT